MKALLSPRSPSNRMGERSRPNGIFFPDESFSDEDGYSSSSSSSDGEYSSGDYVDPMWVPDENLRKPSKRRNSKLRTTSKPIESTKTKSKPKKTKKTSSPDRVRTPSKEDCSLTTPTTPPSSPPFTIDSPSAKSSASPASTPVTSPVPIIKKKSRPHLFPLRRLSLNLSAEAHSPPSSPTGGSVISSSPPRSPPQLASGSSPTRRVTPPLRRRHSTFVRNKKRRTYVRDQPNGNTADTTNYTTSNPHQPKPTVSHTKHLLSVSGSLLMTRRTKEETEQDDPGVRARSSSAIDPSAAQRRRRLSASGISGLTKDEAKRAKSKKVEELKMMGSTRHESDENEEADPDTPRTPVKEKLRRLSKVGMKVTSLELFAAFVNETRGDSPKDNSNKENSSEHSGTQHQLRPTMSDQGLRDKKDNNNKEKEKDKPRKLKRSLTVQDNRKGRQIQVPQPQERDKDWKEKRKAQSYERVVPLLAFHVLTKQEQEDSVAMPPEDAAPAAAPSKAEGDKASMKRSGGRPGSARERKLREILFKEQQTPKVPKKEEQLA